MRLHILLKHLHEEIFTKKWTQNPLKTLLVGNLSGVCAGGGHPQRLPHAPAGRQQDRPQRRPAPAQVPFSAQPTDQTHHTCPGDLSTSM